MRAGHMSHEHQEGNSYLEHPSILVCERRGRLHHANQAKDAQHAGDPRLADGRWSRRCVVLVDVCAVLLMFRLSLVR